MIIDGKTLANTILETLKQTVSTLQTRGITPTMAVILVGDDPGSASYVRQKEKAAARIGAQLQISNYQFQIDKKTVQKKINALNNDPSIHGIIIQRPLPPHLQDDTLLNNIIPTKDVDGFVPGTLYTVPVASAVVKILNLIYHHKNIHDENFDQWLQKKSIVIMGRGETAGKPIAHQLQMSNDKCQIITSQTPEETKTAALKHADIIISCVGKSVIHNNQIKQGVILISVGIWRDSEGKLHGDYEEEDIKHTASFYTLTPGGVGPINVACLMENLVTAASPH